MGHRALRPAAAAKGAKAAHRQVAPLVVVELLQAAAAVWRLLAALAARLAVLAARVALAARAAWRRAGQGASQVQAEVAGARRVLWDTTFAGWCANLIRRWQLAAALVNLVPRFPMARQRVMVPFAARRATWMKNCATAPASQRVSLAMRRPSRDAPRDSIRMRLPNNRFRRPSREYRMPAFK